MFLLFSLLIPLCSPYKILVYNSKFGHSNVNFFGSIADILVEAGHDVTVLLPEIDAQWGDGATKVEKKIRVPQTAETKQLTDLLNSEIVDWFAMDPLDFVVPFIFGTPYADRFVLQCRGTLEEPGLIERLRGEHFDVMIAENFDMCGIGLSHLIRPRSLITGAASVPIAWMTQEFGLPMATSYNPSPLISHLDVHSMWSRLKNLYAHAVFYRLFYTSRSLVENLFKEKFGADFPSLTEISSHAAYTLINSEPLADAATPTLSRVVYVGGLGARAPRRVDETFEKLLSIRPRTVLISFGSVVTAHRVSAEIKKSLIETVSAFPNITFIWKYEQPEDAFSKEAEISAPNLHLIQWLPQNDLLADERVAAFITHAGMGSTQETMRRGKKGLFIPLFGDQPRNAAMMERSGVGKVFCKGDLTNSAKLTTAVRDLLENEKYSRAAQHLAAMIEKKPFSAREQLIKTIEFAAEFGPSRSLRPQSHDMTFIEYHNLDILAAAGLVISSILFVMFKVPCALFSCCRRKNVKRKAE